MKTAWEWVAFGAFLAVVVMLGDLLAKFFWWTWLQWVLP